MNQKELTQILQSFSFCKIENMPYYVDLAKKYTSNSVLSIQIMQETDFHPHLIDMAERIKGEVTKQRYFAMLEEYLLKHKESYRR